MAKKYTTLYNDESYLNNSVFPQADLYSGLPPNTTLKFYDLRGRTFEELWINLQQDLQTNRELAKMKSIGFANINFDINVISEEEMTAEGARWKSFDFIIKNEITFPRWDESQAEEQRDRNKWRIWLTELKDHEIQHANIAIQCMSKAASDILKLKAASSGELERMTRDVIESSRKELDQLNYKHDRELGTEKMYVNLYRINID